MAFISLFSLVACDSDGGKTNSSGTDDPAKCQHAYGAYVSDGNATCQKDGTKTAYCSKCGSRDTVTDVGSKLAHTFDIYIYDNNASCTQEGTKTAYCTWCNTATDTVPDERHPMEDHSFTNYKSDNNATCDKNGTKTAVCDTCKTATDTVEEKGTAGHKYANGACTVCHASHLTYNLAGDEYTVTGIAADCVSTEIIIPATENGLPVFSISDAAFKGNLTIAKVTLPDSISIIGNEAFSGCTALENVIFGNGLTKIKYRSFADCVSLESIAFPDSLRTLGNEACADCTNLKTVSFGKLMASFLPECFDGCALLESINVSEENASYCSIGGIVYDGSKMSVVYVPYAISGKVEIPDGIIKISGTSFQNRAKITGIYIPKSVHRIETYAFNGCSSLTALYYEGTEEDWNKVIKENDWSFGAPEFTVNFNAVKTEK